MLASIIQPPAAAAAAAAACMHGWPRPTTQILQRALRARPVCPLGYSSNSTTVSTAESAADDMTSSYNDVSSDPLAQISQTLICCARQRRSTALPCSRCMMHKCPGSYSTHARKEKMSYVLDSWKRTEKMQTGFGLRKHYVKHSWDCREVDFWLLDLVIPSCNANVNCCGF